MRRLLIALVVTIALGLLSRLYPLGWSLYDKSLGDVLYAVAAYLALALIFFRWPFRLVAASTLAICLAIEFFKLTSVPLTTASWLPSAGRSAQPSPGTTWPAICSAWQPWWRWIACCSGPSARHRESLAEPAEEDGQEVLVT
jgi:hypothetical protein